MRLRQRRQVCSNVTGLSHHQSSLVTYPVAAPDARKPRPSAYVPSLSNTSDTGHMAKCPVSVLAVIILTPVACAVIIALLPGFEEED
jgi:hypothetical protein